MGLLLETLRSALLEFTVDDWHGDGRYLGYTLFGGRFGTEILFILVDRDDGQWEVWDQRLGRGRRRKAIGRVSSLADATKLVNRHLRTDRRTR